VDFLRGRSVAGAGGEEPILTLDGGEQLDADHVIIATGVRARQLASSAGDAVLTLRGHRDSARLANALGALSSDGRVAIVGGGFIGAEAATSLSSRGLAVTVCEALHRPLERAVGELAAEWLFDLPREAGVDIRVDQLVDDVTPSSDGFGGDWSRSARRGWRRDRLDRI
jgi:3-phenylpropionate/trans-cinnamate dioxygenase ferredoxin reductase subunit